MIEQRTVLALGVIRTDGGTQPRVTQDWTVIADYAQQMLDGAIFPPVIVYYDGEFYWLADGFHRYHAALQCEKDTIDVDVRLGSRRDAVLFSVQANSQHGLRRTNADKHASVEKLLNDPEWSMWSDNEIARRCGVSHPFVGKVREEMTCNGYKSDVRIGIDGRVYNTANIGARTESNSSLDFYRQLNRDVVPGFTFNPVVAEEPRRNIDNIPIAVPHISSKNNEWYTPAKYVEAARRLMDGIDLDPASCELANETIKALVYYDIASNGLNKDWPGRVWLNPPYGYTDGESNQSVWSKHLRDQHKNKITKEAVLLVNAAVDTNWFHDLLAEFPICLTRGRINFTTPEPTISGSTHGSAFVYFGSQLDKFCEIFSEFGTVVRRW